MKTVIIALALAALSLGGCADDLQKFANASAALESKEEAKPVKDAKIEAPKPDAAELSRGAICTWAMAAGIVDLKAATWDSGETKRRIASLHGSYKTTCPVTPAAAAPPSTAAPPVSKKS